MIFLLRGIPSSGKSTLAKLIQSKLHKSVIVSADNYFMCDEGYKFDSSKLPIAHKECQNACYKYTYGDEEYSVIVDNTNTTWNEISPYLDIAKLNNVWVVEVYPNTPWATNVEECFLRNTHGVPRETIQKMADRFEWNLQPKINNYLLGTL